MELNKLNRKRYYTKALLELEAWVFSEEKVKIFANIIASVGKLIVQHKELHTTREVDVVNMEFKVAYPDILYEGGGVSIRVHGGVTYGVTNMLRNKILRIVQTKKDRNTLVHT